MPAAVRRGTRWKNWNTKPILRLRISDLVAGYKKRRLVRRGIPFKTDAYVVGEHMIWGATARILGDLLVRLGS